jgi:hypothetical protein
LITQKSFSWENLGEITFPMNHFLSENDSSRMALCKSERGA